MKWFIQLCPSQLILTEKEPCKVRSAMMAGSTKDHVN